MAIKQRISPWTLFEKSLEKYPGNPCLFFNEDTYTYEQAADQIMYLEKILAAFDFMIGGIYLPNSPEFIFSFLSLNRLGKISVPLSYQLIKKSLSDVIQYADIEILITDPPGLKKLEDSGQDTSLKAVILCDEGKYTPIPFNAPVNGPVKKAVSLPEDTFGICFTSGTTQLPKGVIIPNASIAGNALAVSHVLNFKSHDRFLIPRPMSQAGPIAGDILMTLSAGGSIVILKDLFHPAIFFKTIQNSKVSTSLLINTMLNLLLRYPRREMYDTTSLKRLIFGGMAADGQIVKQALAAFPGVAVYSTYGMTEACTRVSFMERRGLELYPESIGKPIQGCRITIRDNTGAEVPVNTSGNVFIESDYLMAGYYKHESLSEQSLTDYGYKSGDRGYYNEEGVYFICGRNDSVIIQAGNNIYPPEIEGIIRTHKAVADTAVAGIPDALLGQKAVAFVVLRKTAELSAPDFFKWCHENLEHKKLPREVIFLEDIPRTESGKHDYKALTALYSTIKPAG